MALLCVPCCDADSSCDVTVSSRPASQALLSSLSPHIEFLNLNVDEFIGSLASTKSLDLEGLKVGAPPCRRVADYRHSPCRRRRVALLLQDLVKHHRKQHDLVLTSIPSIINVGAFCVNATEIRLHLSKKHMVRSSFLAVAVWLWTHNCRLRLWYLCASLQAVLSRGLQDVADKVVQLIAASAKAEATRLAEGFASIIKELARVPKDIEVPQSASLCGRGRSLPSPLCRARLSDCQELSEVLKFMDSVPPKLQRMTADSHDLHCYYQALADFNTQLPKVRTRTVVMLCRFRIVF